MLALPHIDAEVARLQAEIASACSVTRETLLIGAEEARMVAARDGNGSAMVAASTLKARLRGLLVDRVEDVVARDKLEADKQKTELRTAANLLGEAAESVGLPRTATRAQIIGATAECAIVPPAVFRLMHEKAVQERELQEKTAR
jgi:hypothetical protein